MLKLSEELRPHGFIYPDDPASYPCSLVGGRIGTSGWSLIGGRYGHTRDLVISFEIVLPTGEIIRVGDGGGQEGAQVVERLPAQAPVHGPPGDARHRHRGDARAGQAPRGRVLGLLRLPLLRGRLAGDRRASPARAPRRWPASSSSTSGRSQYLRRDDEAYIPQPDWVKGVVALAMYGNADEVRASAKRMLKIGKASGGEYLGDEISQGDWASRHDRYATPLHGRARGRPGRAHELALRGRVDPLLAAPRRPREVARRSPPTCASASTCSTTGACSPTRTAPSSRGATT